jgi:hypothetical protein
MRISVQLQSCLAGWHDNPLDGARKIPRYRLSKLPPESILSSDG